MKSIAVLTSGGDAPGMNPAVRAVVRTACQRGIKVYGVDRGYTGLINGDIHEMNLRSVSDIITRGGTILYSARCPEFKTEEGLQKAVSTCKKFGIDGMVIIGGDGSFRGARDLSLRGIPCIGLPGTIDNDISCTDYTIGYDTCLNTIVQMVDRIRDTSESHDRCTVVEVMGRGAGYLALEAGIAVGATSIIVPEVEYDIERDVIARIREFQKTGKKHFIVIVAEGVGGTAEIAKKIEAETGVESRATILGHVQRGGSPTARDRIMASQMGSRAVDLLTQGIGNRVVGIRDNKIVDFDIFEALKMTKTIDMKDYELAHEISI
ncbi:MAG: 6-phosphofructokinase [Acutalibacteraceae bacterium]|nr:6-phosphofructokinase [Oscillospiraceae bacterium]MEE0065528.1 6-phosphofructokinase [Acutalibacteraceae bacterium]MCI6974409.1 6-phosphofructokinase [Oscillospiraceae bacterium]MDD7216842.1 6-phosphofructokinase [Oscillospiraceae bacterium]MDY2821508.1 6-phosphofructokinase [Oscillospiraceae bacterium]